MWHCKVSFRLGLIHTHTWTSGRDPSYISLKFGMPGGHSANITVPLYRCHGSPEVKVSADFPLAILGKRFGQCLPHLRRVDRGHRTAIFPAEEALPNTPLVFMATIAHPIREHLNDCLRVGEESGALFDRHTCCAQCHCGACNPWRQFCCSTFKHHLIQIRSPFGRCVHEPEARQFLNLSLRLQFDGSGEGGSPS